MKTPNDDIEQWIKDVKESELIDELWGEHHDLEGLLEAHEAAIEDPIVLPLSEIIDDIKACQDNPPF